MERIKIWQIENKKENLLYLKTKMKKSQVKNQVSVRREHENHSVDKMQLVDKSDKLVLSLTQKLIAIKRIAVILR